MTLEEVWAHAREIMQPNCRVCPECNGRACRGEIPGAGAAGDGSSWTACSEYLARVKIRLDTIHEPWEPDTSAELFGLRLSSPLCLAPIGGMAYNYNGALSDAQWSGMAVSGGRSAGILPFTGDGSRAQYEVGFEAVRAEGGWGVCTVKPWRDNGRIIERAAACAEVGCPAIACDVDAAAFANLGGNLGKVGPKTPADLAEIAKASPIPFIVKGVMTAEGALKCRDAGCAGIVVSTHGGRVLVSGQATAEVLPEIRAAVGDDFTIIVDGAIRTGADIFKVLALGADAAMIGRPFVIAAHGGGADGVRLYAEAKRAELANLMILAGCPTVADITRGKVAIS